MREIKFRAWCETTKKIYQITDIDFNNCVANGVCNGDWQEFSTSKLLQYTGLKDKNGVEIYEGDILINKNQKDHNKNNWIGLVESNNFGWLALKYKDYINPSWLGALSSPVNEPQNAIWITEKCEIIGNIYENPELIENEKS